MRAPAQRLAAHEPEHDPEQPERAERQAGQIEAGLAGPWLSSRRTAASGTSASPIGTLIQKIQCHEASWIIAPPTSGPSATAMPLIPDQTPIAMPRRSGGNASASSVSVSGVAIAAPTPWTARAAISRPIDRGERRSRRRRRVNSAIPAMNIRLRPNRSPSAAPVSSSTA